MRRARIIPATVAVLVVKLSCTTQKTGVVTVTLMRTTGDGREICPPVENVICKSVSCPLAGLGKPADEVLMLTIEANGTVVTAGEKIPVHETS